MTFDSSFFILYIMRRNVVLLLYIVLFIACADKEEPIMSFKLSDVTLKYDWNGGIRDISVEADNIWYISSSVPSWLSIDFKSDTNLSIIAGCNDTKKTRFCDIIFSTAWKADTLYVVQTAKERLAFVGEKLLFMNAEENSFSVEIDKNIGFEVVYLNNADMWLSQTPDFQVGNSISINDLGTTKLSFRVGENPSLNQRFGDIIICNDYYGLADTLCICQAGKSEKYKDGEIEQLQQAIYSDLNLVIMCDGFASKDLNYNGKYYQAACAAADYFFSIEPYKSYRNYFNVYAVFAESREEGVGEKDSWKKTNNKFGTAFGTGTEIVCNDDLVFEYARKVKGLPAGKPLTVIVVLNSAKYAGTTYLYSDGNSIALCPMSDKPSPNDFEGLIHHEAGGHGFGFLCDEYVYYQKAMPESRKQDLKKWQKLGYQMNLDFTDDTSAVLWKDFIGMEKYSKVGAYEGGYEYQYGVWRSEENSCMNNNIPYFNVQSRWSIVSRIMKLSGKEFGISDFIRNDNFVYPEEVDTRSAKEFIPLGNPVWIMAD